MRHLRFSGPWTVTLAAVLGVFGGVGCGGGSDDLKKQVRALETQVTTLRADADRLEERLEAVELNSEATARTTRAEARDDARLERPRLKTIRLAPDDEGESSKPDQEIPATPETESEGARPVIRGTGDRVIKTGEASPSGHLSGGIRRYAEALSMAREGRFEDAIRRFERFAETHPTSLHADNALFWAGRCHMALGHDETALARYADVVRLHPNGNRVRDARIATARLVARLDRRDAGHAVLAHGPQRARGAPREN